VLGRSELRDCEGTADEARSFTVHKASSAFGEVGPTMLLKIIGAIIVIWVAFAVLGFVFKVLGTLLIVGAVITVGALGYAAIKGGSSRKQIR
jgi:uncharacterized membrane protein